MIFFISLISSLLILQYINTGSDFQTSFFQDGENISANVAITHDTAYGIDIASATIFASQAAQRGSAVKVEEGVYFIRGQFVKNTEQTLILSTDSIREDARVGFTVSETLATSSLNLANVFTSSGSS